MTRPIGQSTERFAIDAVRKLPLALVLMVPCFVAAQTSIGPGVAVVQVTQCITSPCTLTSSSLAGDAMMYVYSDSPSPVITDNKGNSYSTIDSITTSGLYSVAAITCNAIVGTSTYNFTVSGITRFYVYEVSGLPTSACFGVHGVSLLSSCTTCLGTSITTLAGMFIPTFTASGGGQFHSFTIELLNSGHTGGGIFAWQRAFGGGATVPLASGSYTSPGSWSDSFSTGMYYSGGESFPSHTLIQVTQDGE